MSQQIINISTPDDGLGDVLRNGFDKTNQNFAELYNGKVDKIAGQGLSENNFTDADKAKLDGIEAGAEVNVQADFLETDPTADSFILNKPPSLYSSVGYFHISNSLTAQSISSGVAADLLNNNLGTYSSSAQAPYGISAIWNTTTNAFDFSQLSLGDMVSLRVDLLIDTTATNQDFRAYITLGIGTASEYKLLLNQSTYKSAVTNYAFLEEVNFSIDNEDWRTAPAKISVLTDSSASVLVNGWYVPIIRKSVNVIDITGTTPNLQQVTDSGSTTTNDITIESASYYSLLTSGGLNINNNTTLDNISISPIEIALRDDVYSSAILSRTRTQNTDFYFEDEGGEKSIATREWVNDNINGEIVNITTPSPNHTGVTTETNITSYNFVIPANTLSDGDTLRIENMLWEKIGVLNASTCRVRLSNTNNFATASQVAVFAASASNIYMRGCRTFNINSGLLRGVSFTANGIFNDFTLTNLGFSTLALDFTQPIYGFISLQVTNSADIVLMRELKIRKI